MFKLANNVLTTLAGSVSVGATSMLVTAASGVNNSPPDPAGGVGVLTLVDNLSAPTKTEIIYYTGRNGTGPYTLTGVTRGREGTIDQSWNAGEFVFQAATAAAVLAIGTGCMNPAELTQDLHIPPEYNARLIGPVSVSSGVTLAVGNNSTLTIE